MIQRATTGGVIVFLALVVEAGGSHARAQEEDPITAAGDSAAEAAQGDPAPAVTPEDSAALLRAARNDQARFERFRRTRLPYTWGGGSPRCDERIGRFCLTHGQGGDDWVAPPEDEEVVERRLSLAEDLGEVAQLIPGDGWIAGQRVRYLVETSRLDEALSAARECRAERWWCHALQGFVYHYSARPAEADSAFVIALEAMEESERDRWTDLSLILDERTVRSYRRIQQDERGPFEERFWRLADPILIHPGNEIRSEHFARHVWDQLQYRAQSTDGISWGYDLREILIRYGWPAGWEQTRTFGTTMGPPPLVSHYSSSPRYLLPPAVALLEESATDGEWDADVPRSRTGYNLPLADSTARWFSPLAHQVAVFQRGDSAVVVAGYELPADSLAEDARIRAGLTVLPTLDPLVDSDQVIREDATPTGALMIETEARPVIMSLELVVEDERRLARARYGLDIAPVPPGLLSLSDLLLISDVETLPDSLHEAAPRARGSARVGSGEQIGLYWEIYGVDPETTPELTLSLRLLQAHRGWLRRMAERTGLLREVTPIRLRWQEGVNSAPYLPRSLAVQIPDIPPGMYTLELTVEPPGREPLSVRKDIEVIDG